MEAIKESIAQLSHIMYQKIDAFESEYHKNTTAAAATTSSLSSEFNSFKMFVVTALRSLQDQIEVLDRGVDDQEMRGRRKILLFHGLQEHNNEDGAAVVAKLVVDKLKVPDFVKSNIVRCHRIGRASVPGKPRPMLVKFCNMALRSHVWSSKTNFKGSGVTVSEFLTKTRHETFMAARERFGVSKCWTRDGSIYIQDAEGTKHRVRCMKELECIISGATNVAISQASAEVVKKIATPPPAPVPTKQRRAAATGRKY